MYPSQSHTFSLNVFEVGKNGNMTCEVQLPYLIGLKVPQDRTQVSGDTVQCLKYKISHTSLASFSTIYYCCFQEGKQNKTPLVEKKLKMCYFLLNILSICKGFLSYSAFQFSPVSATWGILLFYPMCVVSKQIKKTCLSLGAGWRTLWFLFLLFKCLCLLATICIFFQSLLNMIRIYICCLNSCDAKILLGINVLVYSWVCSPNHTYPWCKCRVCSEPSYGILSSEESVYQ